MIISLFTIVFTLTIFYVKDIQKNNEANNDEQDNLVVKRKISDDRISLLSYHDHGFQDSLMATLKFLYSGDMNYLILNLMWTGVSIAYYSSILLPIMCL